MSQDLRRVASQARAYNANVIVLSVPDGGYVNVSALEGYCRIGFEMHDTFLLFPATSLQTP